MFSQLGPLFKSTFRQAESNDTRQAIPHNERDNSRKKQEKNKQENKSTDLWEDNTTVSVGALRAFLISFLKTIPGGEDVSTMIENTADTISKRPSENKRPTSMANARAVRAYQSIAKTTPNPPTRPAQQKSSSTVKPTADLLESKEIRDIHELIDDLDSLAQKGVQNLRILRADSFLASLKNAVLIEKSKI